MASRIFADDAIIAMSGHVVFLQVSAVGDSKFSFSGYKSSKVDRFFETLTALYGEDQESIYYMAPIFPCFSAEIAPRTLKEYRDPSVLSKIGAGMIYLPPKGLSVRALQDLQAFSSKEAYGKYETKAVEELERHATPPDFKLRRASDPLYKAMIELGTSPEAQEQYRTSPEQFAARFAELSAQERRALGSKSIAAVRAASTDRFSGSMPSYDPIQRT